jgi:hypothetical protein
VAIAALNDFDGLVVHWRDCHADHCQARRQASFSRAGSAQGGLVLG